MEVEIGEEFIATRGRKLSEDQEVSQFEDSKRDDIN
jgi:hypothetical protein